MQYPISHPRLGQFAPYVAAIALSLLLLPVSAARANAESLTAPATAEEAAAVAVDPAAPSTEASDEGQELAASPADPAQTQTDSSSSTPASEIGSAASEVAESAVQSLPPPRQPDTAAPSGDRVTGAAAEIRREVAGAAGSGIATAKATVRTLERAGPIDRVRALAHDQLQDGLDRFAPALPRVPSLAAGADNPTDAASPHPSPLPGVASPPSAVATSPLERFVPLDGRLPHSPAAPADVEFLRLLTPDVAGGARGGPGPSPAAGPKGVSLDRPGGHAETAPPPGDPGPAPLPDLPQLIASGASSSFVPPIAALLALLALAAPAILRRLREAPGFRAPTPFVCALERPG